MYGKTDSILTRNKKKFDNLSQLWSSIQKSVSRLGINQSTPFARYKTAMKRRDLNTNTLIL